MYQPAHLNSFLRMLILHMNTVVDLGDSLLEQNSNDELQHDHEAMFVLQMSQAREWVDRLGLFDTSLERQADEFLAATFGIEKLLVERSSRDKDFRLENRIAHADSASVIRAGLSDNINIETMTGAIFEFLAQIEEQYDIASEISGEKPRTGYVPFAKRADNATSAQIIPMFKKTG